MGHVQVAGDLATSDFLDQADTKHMENGKQTILVVEDEEMVRGLICEVLRREGYRVVACSDATEGIEASNRYGKGIDLLLTDVVMPGMNGPEMASRIQKEFPHLRVVFMSGYSEQALARNAQVDGSFEYLQKPFTLRSLTQKLANVLGRPEAQAG
jgi:two-component system, cell cycle sensor histidine kinase and response regulator CckA